MASVSHEHIEIVQGAGGPKARIIGRRIRVEDIATWHEKLGMSADEIVDQYQSLTLADVHAALTYYWDHRPQVEDEIAQEELLIEELRRANPGPLAEKLQRLGLG